jgi:hypothetical protein
MAAASEKILGRFFAKEKYHDEHSEIRESQDGESYNDGELTIDAIKRRKFYKYCKMIESGEIGRLKGTVEVRKLSGIKSSYLFSTKANLWELYTLLESFRSVEAKDIQRLTDGLQEYIRVSDEWITLREKKPLTVDLEILSYVECSKPEMESRLISETDDEL